MRNKPLPGIMKHSPMKQTEGPKMPKDHPVKPPPSVSHETVPYDGPKVIGGSAPNPAKTAVSIVKGVKNLYKKITDK